MWSAMALLIMAPEPPEIEIYCAKKYCVNNAGVYIGSGQQIGFGIERKQSRAS
jgi:hypothetical protein